MISFFSDACNNFKVSLISIQLFSILLGINIKVSTITLNQSNVSNTSNAIAQFFGKIKHYTDEALKWSPY